MDSRVGFGYDIHQLSEGYDLWLGGIKLDFEKGAVGHSDADVLIHAICDAILGAADLRDIGFHFPDTDPAYKGADSKKLLARVMELLSEKGYRFGNVDATVVLERPKVNPHIDAIKDCLSEVIGCERGQISIKATTSEKMSFVGEEKGIKAYAVCMIHPN